jgi:hypothetical protein
MFGKASYDINQLQGPWRIMDNKEHTVFANYSRNVVASCWFLTVETWVYFLVTSSEDFWTKCHERVSPTAAAWNTLQVHTFVFRI